MRVDWINEGDKNTKSFHLSTLIWRRRNRIELMNVKGVWVKNKKELKGSAIDFYSSLFLAKQTPDRLEFIRGKFPPITDDQRHELEMEVSSNEVWRALKSMGPWKSPGPNGFPLGFFQRT